MQDKAEKIALLKTYLDTRRGRGHTFAMVNGVAGAGSAREQFAQRAGRLLHGEFYGEFYTVFTPQEAEKYRGRVFGVEAELAGEVDIEFITVGEGKEIRPASGKKEKNTKLSPKAVAIKTKTKPEPTDEISSTLKLPSIAAKVTQAKIKVGQDAVGYVERVLRYCWTIGLSPKEISEGLGMTGVNAVSRLSSACKGCVAVGLMVVDSDGRYSVNQSEIQRLKTLSSLR